MLREKAEGYGDLTERVVASNLMQATLDEVAPASGRYHTYRGFRFSIRLYHDRPCVAMATYSQAIEGTADLVAVD